MGPVNGNGGISLVPIPLNVTELVSPKWWDDPYNNTFQPNSTVKVLSQKGTLCIEQKLAGGQQFGYSKCNHTIEYNYTHWQGNSSEEQRDCYSPDSQKEPIQNPACDPALRTEWKNVWNLTLNDTCWSIFSLKGDVGKVLKAQDFTQHK